MQYPDLDSLLQEMRATTATLRTQGREATQLRLEWERRRTDDPELIKKLDRALAGEITWLDVLTSAEYEKAHAAEFQQAQEDFELRRGEGDLPTAEEAEAGLDEFVTAMRADVEEARETAAAEPPPAAEQKGEWVYRPTISDN